MEFRKLRADEIDCRIGSIGKTNNGLSLLLYKDARADMNVLDETVGSMNWQRSHQVIDGNLYCTVSVWDSEKSQWVSKQDVGTESYTEKEKGQASDSFKRACFNLGIGRELYTSPFIWVKSTDCSIKDGKCYDTFKVNKIEYTGNVISALEVYNEKLNRVVFKMGKTKPDDFEEELASDIEKKTFMGMCKQLDVDWRQIREQAGYNPNSPMTVAEHGKVMIILAEIEGSRK